MLTTATIIAIAAIVIGTLNPWLIVWYQNVRNSRTTPTTHKGIRPRATHRKLR